MEPLSAASSVFAVVSVAIELAKGIHKLVVFCKAVQDAPEGLLQLYEDLESLAELLEQVGLVDDSCGDRLVGIAVDKCRLCLGRLEKKIRGPAWELGSESRGRRFRGKVKVVLRQSEIRDLREEIERAKSQLQIALVNSLIHLSQFQYRSHKQFLLEFQETIGRSTQEGFKSILQEQKQLSNTMQLVTNEEPGVKDSISLHINLETRSGSGPSTPTQRTVKHVTTLIRDTDVFNYFLAIQKRTRSRRTTSVFPSGIKSTEEEHSDYIFYPAPFLRWVGLSYGVYMQTRSTSWQFSLQPFNVVRESSPIFEFCRNGNVDAVQTLIGLGEASVRDRDPLGRTPLWVAAVSLQAEVAELLLREGADPHVCDWKWNCPPIAAIQGSDSTDVALKKSILSVFQTHSPDGHDSLELLYSVGKLLFSYRPKRMINMGLSERKLGAHVLLKQLFNLLPQDDDSWIKIFSVMMQLFYDAEILRWTIGRIGGMIPFTDEDSAVHKALGIKLFIRDPTSARMIVEKTERADLHRLWGREYSFTLPGTPMELALYHPGLFGAWVRSLREAGIDLGEFFREELEVESGALRREGWSVETLMEVLLLVDAEEEMVGGSPFLRCERCGKAEGSSCLKVDLVWRRRLREIRAQNLKGESLGRDSNISVPSDSPWVLPKKTLMAQAKSWISEKLPYTIVCSVECQDGVSVAWVFEDKAKEEHFLSGYPHHELEPKETALDIGNCSPSGETCPTERMPGAFVE
ncbi:hypothetical protein BKA65DRAFT_519487 [Rhexocercosporidium sp. MPI-PUGE-AT-0058]|nr:hypothetical protein BKA65DRAFT_519487 [Rhexocercosporidium sp. MPI-PUGE-AT-0058]